MKELYILANAYEKGIAAVNHLLAYVKGIAEYDVSITVFFLRPIEGQKFDGHIPNVKFVYLWENKYGKNKYINFIRPIISFYSLMKPSIPVLNCSADAQIILRLKRKIRLYHKRTENPDFAKAKFNDLYKRDLHKADGILLITPSLRQLFIDDYGVSPEKAIVTNMVVDESRFENLPEVTPTKSIAYCGTISERKDGVDYLVKAFALVHEKYPDWELVMMGNFENKAVKERILALIKTNGITDKVKLTGLVSPEQMPMMLKQASILALARPMQKEKAFGFATKIGEYLMTERPVVLTDVGDTSYYLTHLESAILTKPNDEKDFAEKLIWTIEHAEEARAIGKQGRLVAEKQFNYKIESKKVVDFIFSK